MKRASIKGIIVKEFLQIRRDRRLFPIIVIAPVIELFLFGYAVSLDIKSVPMGVLDIRHDAYSHEIILKLSSSDYFRIKKVTGSPEYLLKLMDEGRIKAGVIIEKDGDVNVVIDGSDNNAATIIQGYLESALSNRIPEIIPSIRILFNPEMKSVNFMVPGVTGMVVMIITMVLGAGIMVKEKERGTFEHLLVTPASGIEIISGKLVPFIVIGYLDILLVVGAGLLFFRVPFRGNFLFLLFASFPFILTSLAISLLSSIISETQHQAVMTAFLIMFPNIILSGFIFPIEAMPIILQKFTYLLPMSYYIRITRGIFLKGAGLKELSGDIVSLWIFSIVTLIMAVNRFRKKLR